MKPWLIMIIIYLTSYLTTYVTSYLTSSLKSYLTSYVNSYLTSRLTSYVASDVKRLVTSCFTRYWKLVFKKLPSALGLAQHLQHVSHSFLTKRTDCKPANNLFIFSALSQINFFTSTRLAIDFLIYNIYVRFGSSQCFPAGYWYTNGHQQCTLVGWSLPS